MLAIEGAQPVIADRDPMGVAPEIAQHRRRAPEGRLDVDDPVGLEEGVDEGVPLRRVAQVRGGAGEVEFLAVVRRRNAATNFPRKTRRRTVTGRKKPAHLGWIQR